MRFLKQSQIKYLAKESRKLKRRFSHDKPYDSDDGDVISFPELKKVRSKNPKKIYFGNLNVISIRNKFESVQEIINDTFNIFLINLTKIQSSFTNAQFDIPEYGYLQKDVTILEEVFFFLSGKIIAAKCFKKV